MARVLFIGVVLALLPVTLARKPSGPTLYEAAERMRHLSVDECKRYFSQGYCEWFGGADLVDLTCDANYHLERQWACRGMGRATTSLGRLVCHRDDARGSRQPCGLECAR